MRLPYYTNSLHCCVADLEMFNIYICKQLLQDLKTLRSLLDYVFRYDAITFYNLLLAEKSKAAAVRDPPLWIGTPAAER